MGLRRKQSGRLNKPDPSNKTFKGTLIFVLSLCILLGLFGWRNAVAEDYSCGLEEHTHTDECYENVLVCTNEDADHVHDKSCYEKTLICDLTEHVHTEDCLASVEQEELDEDNAIVALAAEEESVPTAQANIPTSFIGTTPPNTVINLFDYWTTDQEEPSETKAKVYGGINQREKNENTSTYDASTDRPLVFWLDSNDSLGLANFYTGNNTTRKGIVQNQLGDDGYPLINWSNSSYWPSAFTSGTDSETLQKENASLAYLFDSSEYPDILGKRVYSNVDGLFQVNDQGYYYYDCTQNYAWYNEQKNAFELYEGTPTTFAQFFPFATFETTNSTTNNQDPILNHYFGLTMTTRFVQDYSGHISAGSNANEMIFDFSGDDDVWIFIDDVLVSDVGGIHSKSGTTINFATGEVTYYNPTNGASLGSTTLQKQFDAVYSANGEASVVDRVADKNNGWKISNGNYIFSDDTSHTLKFFYMERGNSASNLKLTTNLLQIPETSVTKVDQYENPMGDVPLAIYQATASTETDSSTYYFVDDTGKYNILPSSVTNDMVDPTTGVISGNLTTSDGSTVSATISPKIKGSTNTVTYDTNGNLVSGSGEWILNDSDGVPYTTQDLKDKIGSNQLIMREIQVPEGYRTVSDNILLYFDKGEHLTTPNAYESGVWPSPNVLVTASNTLYPSSGGHSGIDYYYYDTASKAWKSEGTLFAVVMKRNGAALSDFETTWYPVYGNDTSGYKTTSTTGLKAVLEAYQENLKNYSDPTFTETSAGMQVYLTDLPGSLERYYTYMLEHNKDAIKSAAGETEPQYCVCYFYSTADKSKLKDLNLSKLTEDDAASYITRVVSHSGFVNDSNGSNYEGFYLKWSSTIEITNIEDRLYFQKTDELGNFVDGATFALYNADEDENGKVYLVANDQAGTPVYLGDDSDGDNKGTATVNGSPYTYSIDNNGDINILDGSGNIAYTINPAKNADGVTLTDVTTDESTNQIEDGTGKFEKLLDGRYVLREISAPEGYLLNTELVKVLVNEDGVYANAGSEDDGVIVGNGAGFLIPTFNNCASPNVIDETLTWIYTLLRVNTEDNGYDAIDDLNVLYAPTGDSLTDKDGNLENNWLYAMANSKDDGGLSSGTTDVRSSAMVTYLQYGGNQITDKTHILFDYMANSDQSARFLSDTYDYNTGEGQGSLRLYTDQGWSELSILQDYIYGSKQTTTNKTTTYVDLTSQDAYGKKNVNLNLAHLFSNSTFVRVSDPKPVDVMLTKVDATGENSLSGAEFIVYKNAQNGAGKVYYQYGSGGTSWVDSQKDATVLSFYDQDKTIYGLATGTYYIQETKAPAGYVLETKPWTMVLTETKLGTTDTQAPSNTMAKTIVSLTKPGATDAQETTVYTLSDDTYKQLADLKLVNTQIYTLPSSGSFGILPFILIGTLILGFSVFLLIKKDKEPKS